MRSLPHALHVLAGQQAGVLANSQLAAHGFLSREIDVRVRAGLWRRISGRTTAMHSGAPSRTSLLRAASLHHPSVGLTGSAALEAYGMPPNRESRILLLGPRGSRRPPFDGCRIISLPLPRFTQDSGPMRTDPALSAAFAMGTAMSLRQAVFHCTWVVQRGLATLDDIRVAIDGLPGSATMGAARRVLDRVDPGVHSVHEFDFATQCRRRGLPRPSLQEARLDGEGRHRYIDATFHMPLGTLVVEIDGLQHLDAKVMLDDQWRSNELALQNATVVRVPGLALQLDPDRAFHQIRRHLEQLGWRGARTR